MKTLVPILSCLFCISILSAQPDNDFCSGAIVLDEQFIGTTDCSDLGWRSLTVDLVGATPTPNLMGCVFADIPSVWYEIPVGSEDFLLSIKVAAGPGAEPAFQILKGNCNNLQSVTDCRIGYNGPAFSHDLEVQQNTTYYIVCGDVSGSSGPLTLSWGKHPAQPICIFDDRIEPVYRSGGQPVLGPYSPGDTVGFSYSVKLQVAIGEQNCQWMHGVVPVFGSGWDPGSFDTLGRPLDAQMNGLDFPAPNVENGGHWDWWTGIKYHHPHCYMNTGDFDGNGTLDLCDGRSDPDCTGPGLTTETGCNGPCWNSISPDDPGCGSELPPGWFSSGVDGSCGGQVGWPAVDWGDGNTCNGPTGPWNFTFKVVIPEDLGKGETDGDFSVTMHSFADGETGSWTGGPSVCGGDLPTRYDAQVRVPCSVEDGVADVAGSVFADLDESCDLSDPEPILRYRIARLRAVATGDIQYVLSNANGIFQTSVDTGLYWVIPALDSNQTACPDSILLDARTPCSLSQAAFAVQAPNWCTESASLHLTHGRLRVCEPATVYVDVANTGRFAMLDQELVVKLDSLLHFESSTHPYDDLGNQSYQIHLPDIPPGGEVKVWITVTVSCDAPIGYTHCSSASIEDPLCPGLLLMQESCRPNGVAIDPNHKIDASDVTYAHTLINDASPIPYEVHFQNTGTDFARHITILDTLPSRLNINTFKFLGSSHPVEVRLTDNHVLKFIFENINLPDSSENFLESMGYVAYAIAPVDDLTMGDTIPNRAAIFFDFNEAVLTNTKVHEVSCGAEIEVENILVAADDGSGNGSITIVVPDSAAYTFLWDNGSTEMMIDGLNAGFYEVTITNTNDCERIVTVEVPVTTGVDDQQAATHVVLYPNPAKNTVHLLAQGGQIRQVEVLSLSGQVLMRRNAGDNQGYALQLEGLDPAMYFCRVTTESGMQMLKFVVSR